MPSGRLKQARPQPEACVPSRYQQFLRRCYCGIAVAALGSKDNSRIRLLPLLFKA